MALLRSGQVLAQSRRRSELWLSDILRINTADVQLCTSYGPIFGMLINQPKVCRCGVYLASDLHTYLYPKRKGLDRSMGKRGVSGASDWLAFQKLADM